jgi:hypothetical protein
MDGYGARSRFSLSFPQPVTGEKRGGREKGNGRKAGGRESFMALPRPWHGVLPRVTVRHSRLSGFSSIAMTLLGVFTYLFVNAGAGFIIAIIGIAMYLFYRRMNSPSRPAGKPAADGKAAS